MICDFCSDTHVTSRLRVKTFVLEEFGYKSLEDFFACRACTTLALARDKKGLFIRSLEAFRIGGKRPGGEELLDLALPIALLQREFFKHWEGEIEPVNGRGEAS